MKKRINLDCIASLAITALAVFMSPAMALADCPGYYKGLLESIRLSDAIIEAGKLSLEDIHRLGNDRFHHYTVKRLVSGKGFVSGQAIPVFSSNAIPSEDLNNVWRRSGLFYRTLDGSSYAFDEGTTTFFLLQNMQNQYCLVASLSVFKESSLMDPNELLRGYLAIRNSTPSDQGIALLKILLRFTDKPRSGDVFPINTITYDLKQLQKYIKVSKSSALIGKAFDRLMAYPDDIMWAVTPLMSVPQKRVVMSYVLQRYDADQSNPRHYDDMAYVMGVDPSRSNPKAILKAAREFAR